jgi:peptide/nickel transport system substrate-binding protein
MSDVSMDEVAGVSRRQFLGLTAVSAAAMGVAAIAGESGVAAASAPGNVLRVGWNTPPDVLNPLTFTTTASNEILWLIYDTLMGYDINLNEQPQLAQQRRVSADGTRYTFTLRPNATWHDGQPVTADDVVFTYNLIGKNNLGVAAWCLTDFKSAVATGAHQVTITYTKPQAFDPSVEVPILPKHLWGKMTAKQASSYANAHPVGSGPFTFVNWSQGQSLQVARNPHFWGAAPKAAGIIWVQFENSDVMVQSLTSGSIDIIPEVPALLWKGLAGKPGVAAVEMESFSFHHIGFNVSQSKKSGANPLIRDKTVRQALSYALSRQQLVDLCLAGRGLPGSSLLPASFGYWQEKIPQSQQFDNNPAKANAMLDAAGYKKGSNGIRHDASGHPLSFRLIAIQTTDEDVLAGQIFVQRAKAIGVELTFSTLDATTLSNIVYNAAAPNWDIFIWGWDSNVPDPNYLLSVELTSQIGGNSDTYYASPRYDALFNQQAVTMNKTQRAVLVHEMQKLFYDDAAYCVMWYQSKLQAYRTDTWKGWQETRGGIIYNFTRANYLSVQPA